MVRKEIEDETDRLTEKSKRISPVPIHLSIYSPNGKEFIFYIFWWDNVFHYSLILKSPHGSGIWKEKAFAVVIKHN